MMTNLLVGISHFIISTIGTLGYSGVILLMAIESAAIPLPSEVIMPFAGFLILNGRFSLLGLALAGAIGSTIGSLVTYYIGYYGGRRLILKYEHIVLISPRELELTERFFNRFKKSSTFIGRLLPVIRTFISIPAGIAKVPIRTFVVNAFIGSFIWSYFLAWLGKKLGDNWDVLGKYFHKFDLVIVGLVLIGIVYYIYAHLSARRGVDRT